MLTSNALKATSFSIAVAAILSFEGCGASSETGAYSNLCYYYYVTTRTSLPEFHTDLFQTADSAGQRLDVYVSLKEARLKYEKIGNAYRATYTANIRLRHEDEPVLMKEVQRTVWKTSYPTSSDSSYDAFLVSFRVTPGEYTAEIVLTDGISGEKAIRRYDKYIPDISKARASLSDILLLVRYDTVGQGRKITPFLLPNAGLLSDTLKFFTVLSSHGGSGDSVFFKIYQLESHERLPSGFSGALLSSRAVNYDPCRMGVDTIPIYSFPVPVNVNSGFTYIFGGVPKPPPGNYILRVTFDDHQGQHASSSLPFRIRGRYFPNVMEDLGEMVNSTAYIASRGELEKITAVKTDSAVKVNLHNFWTDFGGQAKMVEYYRRVSQANRLFSTCIDGWRTPMGMLYVICGPPDYVECRGSFAERWMWIRPSTDDRVVVDFRLTRDTHNPDDRYYGVENIYSNLNFWSYYVSRWRTPY